MTSKHVGSAGNGEEPYSSDTYEGSECESSSETITVTICSPSGDAFDIPMKEGECIQDLKIRIRTSKVTRERSRRGMRKISSRD